MKTWVSGCAMAMACVAGIGSASAADAVETFYKNKTISLVVSTPPGGGYDIWGRLLSRHYGDHIPGKPKMIVQNMVGAGGIRATITIYNVSAKDGTVIGIVNATAPFVPLLEPSNDTKFDASKFGWIGSMARESSFCVVWGGADVKTFQDALSKPLTVGSTGPGAQMERYPVLINRLFGAKFQVINGYAGGNDIYLAMERGEVAGRCGITLPTLRNVHPDWLTEKKATLIIETGLSRDPDESVKDVPMLVDMAKNDEQRSIMELIFANGEIQVPVFTPPGIPADRLEALRKAFKETLDDPALIADANKLKLTPRYVSGDDVQKLLKRIYAMPPSVVEAAIAATQPANAR